MTERAGRPQASVGSLPARTVFARYCRRTLVATVHGQPSKQAATSCSEAGIARNSRPKKRSRTNRARNRECTMSKPRRLTRRRALQVAAATTALPLVHIRTAGAAGKLNIGFWDHWVPGGTEKMRQQVQAWAD